MSEAWLKLREWLDETEAEERLTMFRETSLSSGVIESYIAEYQERGFLERKTHVQIDRYEDHCTLRADICQRNEHGDWEPCQTEERLVRPEQWNELSVLLEPCFWQQPQRDTASAVLDGDAWSVEGFRGGVYQRVYRHAGSLVDGSGAGVYELGRKLLLLAGFESGK